MDNNLEYWEKRYAKCGGRKTVGNRLWDDERYDEAIRQLAEEVSPILHNHSESVDDANVLDFGCGIGRWTALLQLFFNDYHGVDICEAALDLAAETHQAPDEPNAPQFGLVLDGTIPGEGVYSAIWTCVCLQHIVDEELLKATLQQFHARLADDGIVIVTENVSDHVTNNYLAFRPVERYAELFLEAGMVMLKSAPTTAMGQETHATMVFCKSVQEEEVEQKATKVTKED